MNRKFQGILVLIFCSHITLAQLSINQIQGSYENHNEDSCSVSIYQNTISKRKRSDFSTVRLEQFKLINDTLKTYPYGSDEAPRAAFVLVKSSEDIFLDDLNTGIRYTKYRFKTTTTWLHQINDTLSVAFRVRFDTTDKAIGPFINSLVFYNALRGDSNQFDVLQDFLPPCGKIGFMRFLNPMVGFIGTSGGCYAYYNYLFRTEDGGKTWKQVINQVGIDIFPGLGEKSFIMFNDKEGLIVWLNHDWKIHCSYTDDGGKTWNFEQKTADLPGLPGTKLDITFTPEGSVKIFTENKLVLQSENFGRTFQPVTP